MGFKVPAFNLSANIWRTGGGPPAPPSLTTDCQLRAAGKQSSGQDSSRVGWPFLWELLLPAGTDVRDFANASGQDAVEVPAGSNRRYAVEYVDDVAKGFSNEYRVAFIRKIGPWPSPIP